MPGRKAVNNIDRLLDLDYDELGFPKIPNPISAKRRNDLGEEERKCRFLIAYNVSGGVVGFACTDAGIKKAKYEEWLKDEHFKKRVDDMREEVTDRLQLLMNQRVGIVAPTESFKNTKINDYVLLAALKSLRPEIFDAGVANGQGIRINLEIPRPEREEGSNDLIPSDFQASAVPPLQS